MGTLGLIVGQITSNGAGFIGLARRAFTEDGATLRHIRVAEIKKVAREFDRFPKYSTFDALANSAGVQFPIILIASLTAATEVGYLMLAMRILQAPMGLIGSSISQVYFSRAVDEYRADCLDDFTARTIEGLAKIGIGPLMFLGFTAPYIFGYIFGTEWNRAGEIVAWMTPWFVLQFLVSPVAMSLNVTNNQRKALAVQIGGLALRVSSVLVAGTVMSGVFAIEAYAISGFIFYFVYFVVVCRVTKVTSTHIIIAFKGVIPLIFVAVSLALILKWLVLT